jgi:GNAT superfamily N-acetyltransferase
MAAPLIQICSDAELPRSQQAALDGLFKVQFGHTSYHWAPPQWHALTSFDAVLVSYLRIFERTISVGEETLRVSGVGGVMTLPEWRQRGLASITLRRAAGFMRDESRVDYALLLCRDEVARVYTKLGWETVAGPTTFEQPSGRAMYPHHTMVLRFTARAWPSGPIDLCGLPW